MIMSQVSMPQWTFDDILDSMSVQMFRYDQIASMIQGAEAMQVCVCVQGREMGLMRGERVSTPSPLPIISLPSPTTHTHPDLLPLTHAHITHCRLRAATCSRACTRA